eukprot:gene996-1264_t
MLRQFLVQQSRLITRSTTPTISYNNYCSVTTVNTTQANVVVTKDDVKLGNHIVVEDAEQQRIINALNAIDLRGQTVNISQPSRNAMQTSTLGTHKWVISIPVSPKWHDSLMGWWASKDTLNQLSLSFKTKEAAVAYCKENGLNYNILESDFTKRIKKRYGYRFRYRGDLTGQQVDEKDIN